MYIVLQTTGFQTTIQEFQKGLKGNITFFVPNDSFEETQKSM
jgi:hypothetical protein